MARLRRIALGLIVLFALQAGGAAVALAASGPCCPAMAEAAAKGAPPPCRTLAPVGCCDEPAAGPVPAPAAPPLQGIPISGLAPPAPLAAIAAQGPALGSLAGAARALRSTVLRL